jgi:arsenate reductase
MNKRMNKIYCLSTCGTCNRILGEIGAAKKGFVLQDIKTEKISPAQLDELKEGAGSYEALFSRRALKYKELGLKDKKLTEKDYRRLILE